MVTQGGNSYIILSCQVENGHPITTAQLATIYGYSYLPHPCPKSYAILSLSSNAR